MSPWSGAEAGDEREDRDLFARRARALSAFQPRAVPSLADVLRAVDRSREEREARRARGRALVGMALAAACVAASITNLPRTEAGARGLDGIAAEVDAGARATAAATELAGESCEREPEIVAMSSEPPACFAPPSPFPLGAPSVAGPAPVCASEQVCSIAPPVSH